MSELAPFFASFHPQNSPTALPSMTDFLRGERIGAFSSAHNLDAMLATLDAHHAEISRLLQVDFEEFWKSVACAPSLHEFLDSYMRFHNRFFCKYYEEINQVIANGDLKKDDLDLKVIEFFHRLFSNKGTGDEHSNFLDPEQHTAILRQKKWLELPKLMDISLCFGGELTRKLITEVIRTQPSIINDIGIGLSYFVDTANAFCDRLVESFEVLATSSSSEVTKRDQIIADLLEVRLILEHGVMVMDYFINAYKPSAIFLCSCTKQEELLTSLGRIHDTLNPLLSRQRNQFPPIKPKILLMFWRSRNFSNDIITLARNIFVTCYLTDHAFKESLDRQPIKNLFPGEVDDPITRGDIIFETVVRINQELHSRVHYIKGHLTFLQSLEQGCRLLSRIRMLCEKGWLFLDDDKYKSLSKMMVPPSTKHGFSEEEDGTLWCQRFRKMKGNINFKGWKRGCMNGFF